MFNEDELRELENGFSVSETSNSEMDDQSTPSSRGYNSHRHSEALGFNSLYIGGSAAGGRAKMSNAADAKVRFEQHKLAMEGEVSSVKSRYLKKLSALERQLDQARSEKRELQLLLENQKQVFKLSAQQQEARTAEQLREIREQ